MRHPAVLLALILAVGIAGTVLALKAREGDPQFAGAQQSLTPVEPLQLERLILTTSDPRPGHRGRARRARCGSRVHGALGNPWVCVVRYPVAPPVRYEVTVYSDRSISGRGQPEGRPLRGALVVRGCCVASAP
ncbi:MAG TPA: hypothetical protein VGX16_04145 [Solirubrobacteraceae bacterium]|jgi:hypothetical protein|nr:hypothetical protein [Solirubrobacteraceae bacterium]